MTQSEGGSVDKGTVDKGTALVTGAARRIGRAVALSLAENGFRVAIHHYRSADDAVALRADIQARGGNADTFQADLRDERQVASLVPAVAEALGPVTCLVNNASVFGRDAIDTVTRETWDAHLETNLRAPFVLIQAFAARLPADRSGNIVNIIDERVWNLTPHFISYTLSKAGLWTLTQTLALALAPRIRVNAIGPGATLPSPRQTKAQFDRQQAIMPLGRGTTPEEIAEAVRFVLAAPAVTGQMIALDGGQHLGWEQSGGGHAPPDE